MNPGFISGGNGDGITTLVGMMPGKNIGVAILTNMDGSSAPYVLMAAIWDNFLSVSDTDWSQALSPYDMTAEISASHWQAYQNARVIDAPPSLPLEAYIGTYRHEY
ncbi:MAG: hypothetical protein COA78_15725, partial [Blastopirellula sp.]